MCKNAHGRLANMYVFIFHFIVCYHTVFLQGGTKVSHTHKSCLILDHDHASAVL